MIMLTVEDIVEATGGKLICGSPDANVEGLSTDTRTIRPGEFFIALAGDNFNGNDLAG